MASSPFPTLESLDLAATRQNLGEDRVVALILPPQNNLKPVHNFGSFQGFGMQNSQGKFWNLKYMNIQEILVHIQVSKLLLFAVEKTVGLVSVVWLGLEGALECQQECAKTYRCEHLGCKDVVVIEVFRLERL